jgi:predicted transcriptional regulator
VPQPAKVRESALQQMVKTFFDGSAASAATALLGLSKKMEPEELEALQRAIDEAKDRQ